MIRLMETAQCSEGPRQGEIFNQLELPNFFMRIEQFNKMYGMPTPNAPVGVSAERRAQFKTMLAKELDELDDVPYGGIEELVALADLFGDLIVYVASEARRCGIPLEAVLQIIMDSNSSKLQADGTALFIDGKLQKGPGYWKPEPKIQLLLESMNVNDHNG